MFEINPTFLQFHPTSVGTSWDDEGIDFDGHAVNTDRGVFDVPFKCEVVLAQMTVTEGFAGTSTESEVAFERRFTAGSDTGRATKDIAHFYLGKTGLSDQGEVGYDEVGVGLSLEPGMEVVVKVISGSGAHASGAAGKARPSLLVRYLPETLANLSALTETD